MDETPEPSTPAPRPVRRDTTPPPPVPTAEGEQAGPVRGTGTSHDVAAAEGRVDAIRSGPVQVQTVEVHRPKLTAKERRGALIGGAIGLPLVTIGLVLLGIPLAIWYLATVFRTLYVVIANAIGGSDAATNAGDTLGSVDPNAFGQVSIALAIVGAVLFIAGVVVSWLVLRANGVHRPMLVTLTAVPVGASISTVVTASVGALGGLLFRAGTETVPDILANAALGMAGFALASIVIAVVVGALAWLAMARVFRATIVAGTAPEGGA